MDLSGTHKRSGASFECAGHSHREHRTAPRQLPHLRAVWNNTPRPPPGGSHPTRLRRPLPGKDTRAPSTAGSVFEFLATSSKLLSLRSKLYTTELLRINL